MAQPTRCDGFAHRRRLSHNNLRRKQWRRRQRAARKRRLPRSGSTSNAFGGARMEHPFFLAPYHPSSCCSPDAVHTPGEAREARRPATGPTCQAAECAGTQGEWLAIHNHRKGGLQMAKKAKGGKKKAAKKR